MSFDTYWTTQPADEQNALTADEPEGCADCGDCPCSCDERCPTCKRFFRWSEDRYFGQCIECRMDAAWGY